MRDRLGPAGASTAQVMADELGEHTNEVSVMMVHSIQSRGSRTELATFPPPPPLYYN